MTVAMREGCDVFPIAIYQDRIHTNGFMQAEKIQKIQLRINIVFLTENDGDKFACAAFKLCASGYSLKPHTSDALAEEFANLCCKTL